MSVVFIIEDFLKVTEIRNSNYFISFSNGFSIILTYIYNLSTSTCGILHCIYCILLLDFSKDRGCHDRYRMVVELQLPVQSVPVTTEVVSLNPTHCKMYSIQHYYVIKFVSDLRQVGGFLRVLRFPPSNKTDHHDITEILLKVALNTITLTLQV